MTWPAVVTTHDLVPPVADATPTGAPAEATTETRVIASGHRVEAHSPADRTVTTWASPAREGSGLMTAAR